MTRRGTAPDGPVDTPWIDRNIRLAGAREDQPKPCCRTEAGLQPATSKVWPPSTHEGRETEVMTDMASQGQAVARQQNRWPERFVIASAIAAIMITLGWGAFTALSVPSTVAPSKTTTQIVQEPGLLEQRGGERGGAVAQPVGLPKLHPYVSIRPAVRGMELPNGTFLSPGVNVHERGHARGRD